MYRDVMQPTRVPLPEVQGADSGRHVGAYLRAVIRLAFQPSRRNLLHWTSWGVALGIEFALMALLWDGRIYGWEADLTRTLQDVPGRKPIFDVSSTLTNTLAITFIVPFLALVAVVFALRHRTEAFLILLTFPLHVLGQFPKALVDRERPSDGWDGIEGVGGLQSFPSGHSEYVITFYGFLVYLLLGRVQSRTGRVLLLAGFVGFVLATGFGRIALGRHWPVDVIASYVVGLGLLSGLVWLHRILRSASSAGAQNAV